MLGVLTQSAVAGSLAEAKIRVGWLAGWSKFIAKLSHCKLLQLENKLQGKVVTHFKKLEWWIILMVDCVAILLHFSAIRFPSANRRANCQK